MPVLTDYLKAIDARNEVRMADLVREVQATKEHLAQSQATYASQVLGLFSTGLTVEMRAATPSLLRLGESTTLTPTPTTTTAPTPAPAPAPTPAPALALEPELLQYRMCRTVQTVEELWREWTVGLQGTPAIAALDSRWGSRWRAGRQSELQWYSLRLEVIKEIRRLAQSRRTSEVVAMRVLNL